MKYTIYDPHTGAIQAHFESTDPVQAQNNLADQHWIQGHYHPDHFYVEQGRAVEKPPKPTDENTYEFNFNSGTWQVDITRTAQMQRRRRDALLADLDRVNPVWFSTLDELQRTELQQYRQALLSVPQQTGFPTHLEWPTKPHWL